MDSFIVWSLVYECLLLYFFSYCLPVMDFTAPLHVPIISVCQHLKISLEIRHILLLCGLVFS